MEIFHFIVFCLLPLISLINGAKILGVFHMPSYSHYQMSSVLLKELAARGHEVTAITRYEEKGKVKNFKTVHITDELDTFKDIKRNTLMMGKRNVFQNIIYSDLAFIAYTENTLNNTNVQSLINSNEKFDIVILERLLNNALHGLCYHFQAHCVVFSPQRSTRWTNVQMGNSGSPSYVPDPRSRSSTNMNFLERTYNFLIYIYAEIIYHSYMLPIHNNIMHKYIPNAPHISDIFYNISLMLVNSDISTNPPVPLLPNMIEIGGFHIKPPKTLPKHLKDFLDDAKQGVILFSMGSNLVSEDFSVEKIKAVLNSFSKLNQTILWKWESESLPNQPSNVKLYKWLPQNDVLAHPNVKLFITHGGLLSNFEAVYHGLPIIGIPVFGDQFSNMQFAVQDGYGIAIPFDELTEEIFVTALNEILNNPQYLRIAKMRSRIMHDSGMKPLDKAVFWIEYLLRHNGALHLKSAALNLSWYQYLLLDVLAFVTIIFSLAIFLMYKICIRKRSVIKKSKQE